MARRAIAIALWAYFGWYLASYAAAYAHLPGWLAPVGGVLMATVALHDWRGAFARRAHRETYEARTISE
jgi:hypothetical protein